MPKVDDNVFTTPAADPGTASLEGESGNDPAGLTIEQVQEIVEPIRSDLTTAQQALAASEASRDSLQTQISELQGRVTAPEPTPTPTPDEFVDKFTSDPEGTVADVARAAIAANNQTLAPFLEQQMNTVHEGLVSAEAIRVDSEYGAGTWETHFRPLIDVRVADTRKTNVSSLAQPGWVASEVFGIMGLKRDMLAELKATNTVKVEEGKEAEAQEFMQRFKANGMMGGATTSPEVGAKELSDEEKAYMASRAIPGLKTDIQAVRKSMASGNTLKDYLATKGATKGATQ